MFHLCTTGKHDMGNYSMGNNAVKCWGNVHFTVLANGHCEYYDCHV